MYHRCLPCSWSVYILSIHMSRPLGEYRPTHTYLYRPCRMSPDSGKQSPLMPKNTDDCQLQTASWPPRRRRIALHVVAESYMEQQTLELQIPVRSISIAFSTLNHGTTSHFEPYEAPKQRAERKDVFPRSAMYLFHSCSGDLSPEVVASFARWGPSIRCARQQGYFSCRPAVYWTDTFSFAVAWGIFSKYGSWDFGHRPGQPEFECLVYVAKLEWPSVKLPDGCYCIPAPTTAEDQDELVSVCQSPKLKPQCVRVSSDLQAGPDASSGAMRTWTGLVRGSVSHLRGQEGQTGV